LSANGVDLHADTFADFKFIDAGSKCGKVPIYSWRGKILLKGRRPGCRRDPPWMKFKIGRAYRDRRRWRNRTSARPEPLWACRREESERIAPRPHAFICTGTDNWGDVLTALWV